MTRALVSRMVRNAAAGAFALAVILFSGVAMADHGVTTKFMGAKANAGMATFMVENGKRMLKVTDDFVVPDTPDPHWRVVDSKGTVYLLDRFPLKGDKVARQIELPDYVKDVAKVQVWCAWAQAVLGEATFDHPVQ